MIFAPAYAKVNLALEVVGRRHDGFHDIKSVIATVDWHDVVGVGWQSIAGVDFSQSGDLSSSPGGEQNLAWRAARSLLRASAAGRDGDPAAGGLALRLHKRVPAGAGLAGGSADAAAVLRLGRAVLAGRGIAVPAAALLDLAAELGSDVPALLHGGLVLVTGRGERCFALPVPAVPTYLAVVVAGASATGAVYGGLRPAELGDGGRVDRLVAALVARRRVPDQHCGSALEPPACRLSATLQTSLAALRAAVPGVGWHLTGSGGAAFALAADADGARALCRRAEERAGLPGRACRVLSVHHLVA